MIFQCKHKIKSLLTTVVIKNDGIVDIQGKTVEYTLNKFRIYLCLDCNCVVWEDA